MDAKLCEDCPPVGYETDKTRCLPCPRRLDPERMRKALEFYASNWNYKPNKRYGGLEYSPNETLLDDCGNTARAVLSGDPHG